MKSRGIFFCLAALTLSLGLTAGCARADAAPITATPGIGGQQTTGMETEIQEDTSEYHGRYLMTKNGDPMIILEQEGAVELYLNGGDEHMFDSLESGDKITVQLGPIQETYPGQAQIFSLKRTEKGSLKDIDQSTLDYLEERGWIEQSGEGRIGKESPQNKEQLLYVEDRLYIGTGRPAAPSCGTADGRISEVLRPEERPGKNGQANFGSVGTSFIYLDDGALAVLMEDAAEMEMAAVGNQTGNDYQLFLSDDTVEYNGRFFKKADLSQNTIEWLEFYNSLPEEGRLSMSMVPPDLIEHQQPEDSAVEETR